MAESLLDEVFTPYTPEVGVECQYKERGGVNWFTCKVIAYDNGNVWINNLDTGSKPLKKCHVITFREKQSMELSVGAEMMWNGDKCCVLAIHQHFAWVDRMGIAPPARFKTVFISDLTPL